MKIKRAILAAIFGVLFCFNCSQVFADSSPLTDEQRRAVLSGELMIDPAYNDSSIETFFDKTINVLRSFINNENAYLILFSIAALITLSFIVFYILKNKNKKNS